jgi:putative isomerase
MIDEYSIDTRTTPFSRFGSYLVIGYLLELKEENAGAFLDFARPMKSTGRKAGYYLQTVHGDAPRQEICRLDLIEDGRIVSAQVKATPTEFILESAKGKVRLCFPETKYLRIRTEGVGLRLTGSPGVFEQIIPRGVDRWEYNSMSNRVRLMVTRALGSVRVNAEYSPIEKKCPQLTIDILPETDDGFAEAFCEEFLSTWEPRNYPVSYSDDLQALKANYAQWLETVPVVPAEFEKARLDAAYVNWSCVVDPERLLKRPGMYMSKGMMANIWSWDHCFNAMALAYHHPGLSWDQFMIPFDFQDRFGALPDSVSDSNVLWNHTKPPVHGLMLRRIQTRSMWIDDDHLKEIYQPLSRWTDWWFAYRDDRSLGLPHYNHGNDSGWDNGTIFDFGRPVQTPDLAAFLIVQMDVLADLAKKLRHTSEEKEWRARADRLYRLFVEAFWTGTEFTAIGPNGNKVKSQSLQLCLPLILGHRLAPEMIASIVDRLVSHDGLITEYGLATENPTSNMYSPDGYWRGPIWAPSTLIMVDALNDIGEKDLAESIARSFCRMCQASGMAENFDALTGEGLRDRAYTWTSSVFLILAHEYLRSDG